MKRNELLFHFVAVWFFQCVYLL